MRIREDNAQKLQEWAIANSYLVKGDTGRHYSPFVCHIMNMFDKRVHRGDDYCCEWVSPYGWMPEAGCPLHDEDEVASMPSTIKPPPAG